MHIQVFFVFGYIQRQGARGHGQKNSEQCDLQVALHIQRHRQDRRFHKMLRRDDIMSDYQRSQSHLFEIIQEQLKDKRKFVEKGF